MHTHDGSLTLDDDFETRPTVPRAARPAPLFYLSNEDFARGWIGRRPSFASHPPLPAPRGPSTAARALRVSGLCAALVASLALGALVALQLVEHATVSSADLSSSTTTDDPGGATASKQAPTAAAPRAMTDPKTAALADLPQLDAPRPVGLAGGAPPPKRDAWRPGAAKPVAPRPEVAKPEVAKPEVAKPEVEKPEVEKPEVEKSAGPAVAAAPEPPEDPNGGVVNTGF